MRKILTDTLIRNSFDRWASAAEKNRRDAKVLENGYMRGMHSGMAIGYEVACLGLIRDFPHLFTDADKMRVEIK